MIKQKFNYLTREYDRVEIPEGNYKTYSSDMNEIINCPHCQKELTFGSAFTSMEFHTEFGFGYGVCQDCYDKEFKRRTDWRKDYEKNID